MPSITISIDEELMKRGKEYAIRHQTSLDNLILTLLEDVVKPRETGWLDECFRLMDRAQANSGGKTWRREDAYDVENFR